jgi:hypothetical protein
MAMAESYGKRAMQALLGFGYLLTVLHEKHLGGQVQFTAAALTGVTSSVFLFSLRAMLIWCQPYRCPMLQ